MNASASPPPPLPHLPPEMFISIVQFSLAPDSPRAGADTLARFCRVSSTFRSIALPHLYTHVYLGSDDQARLFVVGLGQGNGGAALCGRVQTVRFATARERQATRAVLRLIPTVREVILEDSQCSHLRRFGSCDAPTLHLDGVRQSYDHATTHPSIIQSTIFFNLRRLVLHDIGVFLMFDLMVLSTASFPALTELLVLDPYEEDEYILASEADDLIPNSLAPQLHHLLLHAGPSDRLPTFVRPFLAAATSLRTLDFSDLNKALEFVYVQHLPLSLETIKIRSDCRASLADDASASDLDDGSNHRFALEAIEHLPSLRRIEIRDGKLDPYLPIVMKACEEHDINLRAPAERDTWPPGLHWTEQRRIFNSGRVGEFDALLHEQA